MKTFVLLMVYCLLLYENFNVHAAQNRIKRKEKRVNSDQIRKRSDFNNHKNLPGFEYGKNLLKFLDGLSSNKQNDKTGRSGIVTKDDQNEALRSFQSRVNDENPQEEQSTTAKSIEDKERSDDNQTERTTTEGEPNNNEAISERSDPETTNSASERSSDDNENNTETSKNEETTPPNSLERDAENSEESTQEVESNDNGEKESENNERSDDKEGSAHEMDQTRSDDSNDNDGERIVTERNIVEEDSESNSKTTEKDKTERSSDDQSEETNEDTNEESEESSIARSDDDENESDNDDSNEEPEESSITRSDDDENASGNDVSNEDPEESSITRSDDDENESDNDVSNEELEETSITRSEDDENGSSEELEESVITRGSEDDENGSSAELEESVITRGSEDDEDESDEELEDSITRGSEDDEDKSGGDESDEELEDIVTRGSEDDEDESDEELEDTVTRGSEDDEDEYDEELSITRGSEDDEDESDEELEDIITRGSEDDEDEYDEELSITRGSEDDQDESDEELEDTITRGSEDDEDEYDEELSITRGSEDDEDESDEELDDTITRGSEHDEDEYDEELEELSITRGSEDYEERDGEEYSDENSIEERGVYYTDYEDERGINEDDEYYEEIEERDGEEYLEEDSIEERGVYYTDYENEREVHQGVEYYGEIEERDSEEYPIQEYSDENFVEERGVDYNDYESERGINDYSEYDGQIEESYNEEYPDQEYSDENVEKINDDIEYNGQIEESYNEEHSDQDYSHENVEDINDDIEYDEQIEESDNEEYPDQEYSHENVEEINDAIEYNGQIEESYNEEYPDQDYSHENVEDINYDIEYDGQIEESDNEEYPDQEYSHENVEEINDDIEYDGQIEQSDNEEYPYPKYYNENVEREYGTDDLYANHGYEGMYEEIPMDVSDYDFDSQSYNYEYPTSYEIDDTGEYGSDYDLNPNLYSQDSQQDYNIGSNILQLIDKPGQGHAADYGSTSEEENDNYRNPYLYSQDSQQDYNLGSNVLQVIEQQGHGQGISIDGKSFIESEQVTVSPQLENIMYLIENVTNNTAEEDVTEPFYNLPEYDYNYKETDEHFNYESNDKEIDENLNYETDDEYTTEKADEIPDIEIGYDFNTVDHGPFSELKMNDFNENILGLYTLRLGYFIRLNMINLLGFVMHQQFQDIGEDVFLQLNTLKNAFQQNLIDPFGLIPVLAQTHDKDANQQIEAVMKQIESQRKKRHCHISFSAKYIMNKLASQKLDIRRIVAHLGYNPLTHKVFDFVTGDGIHEIKIISNLIQDIDDDIDDLNLYLFSPVLKRIYQEIKEEKVVVSEALAGYLLMFYPFPINNFEITYALDQVTMTLTNDKDFMSKCRVIPEVTLTLIDQPIEFLTWILMKILDNLCMSSLHDSAKTLMAGLLDNHLTQYNADNFIELNALPTLLNMISFDKFPLEIVLARDRIKLYLDKILPFLNLNSFVLYNYDTPASKLYGFLGFLLEQDPYVNNDIKSSILAIKSYLIFHIKSISIKFDTLLELSNAWMAPDLIDEIKEQGRKIKNVLMVNMDDINAKIYGEPFKKCFDLDTCFIIAQNILKYILDEKKVSFNFPGCFIDRSKHKFILQRSHLITMDMLDLITPDMFLRETVEAAKILKQYFNEKKFSFNDIELTVECTNFKFILQGLKFILQTVSEIPIVIQKAIRVVVTELEFKVLDHKEIDIRVINWLKTIYLNSMNSDRFLHHFEQMDIFLSTNENLINSILIRINPKKCRDLLSCYNVIVDQINEVDLGYKLPYFNRLSPKLNSLTLYGVDLSKFSTKTLLKIIEDIDEGKTCSSEITASKRYVVDHEDELNSILNTVSCLELTVYECFDLTYETLLYERDKIPEIRLNILQFLLKPIVCNDFKCQWIASLEAGSTVLNPVLEYILMVMQKVGENTDKLHLQLDFFGLIIYLRKTNLSIVLKQYKLRPHVVEQTIIISFLNMVYELPETSKNIKISIENVNNFLTHNSEVYRLNSIMLIGLGRVLIKTTPSLEIKTEINQYISDVYNREDDVVNVLENLMIDCFNVQNCAFDIRNEFENKTNELNDIGKSILGIVAPKSCTLQNCGWLQTPAQRPNTDQITDLMKEIVDEGNEEALGLAEKLAMGEIKNPGIADSAKTHLQNNYGYDEYGAYDGYDEYDAYYGNDAYDGYAEYDGNYGYAGYAGYAGYDEYAGYDDRYENYDYDLENYKQDYNDYTSQYNSSIKQYDDEVSNRLLISSSPPKKPLIFDDEESKYIQENDIFDTDQPKNDIDNLFNISGDKDEFKDYLKKEMKAHPRTKRVKRDSNVTTIPTTKLRHGEAETTTEVVTQNETTTIKLEHTRANLPSIFDLGEEENVRSTKSRSLRLNDEDGITRKFNSVTLLKLIDMIDGNVDNFRIKKLIAVFRRELNKNVGEINFDLSQMEIDCWVLDTCLWDLNDAILKNNLINKRVFKLLLMIIRAKECHKERCPHKIEISRQRYLKFIDTFIKELQNINNPQSNSFHFQTDVEFLIEFLRRRNIDKFLPKEIAFADKTSIIKSTLIEMNKLRLPEEVVQTANNLFNLLYNGSPPKYLHSENIISIIKAFIKQTSDTNVQRELMILKQKVEQKRVAITNILAQIPVDCITLISCVHTLEQRLMNKETNKVAKLLLRILKPKSCIKSKCAWLKQSVQDNFVHMKSSIMKELRLWHEKADSYLVKIEYQQLRYVIITENLIPNFLSLGDFNYDSPLLGILLTISPQIKIKYDMMESIQILTDYMLTKNLPNRVTFRQLKHICKKLTSKTEYVPALSLMEQSLNEFSNRMEAIKKNLHSIDVRCKTFRDCVNELIVGVNFKTDKTSKLIMEALSPSNCPKQKCPWVLTGSKMYEKVGTIHQEISKIEQDEIIPLIVKLRVEYIIDRFQLTNFTALFEDNDKDERKYDFLEILKTISADKNIENSTKMIVDDLNDYFINKKLSNILHDEDLQILIERLIESTHDILVKASMNVAKNVLTRYDEETEHILSNCTISCIKIKPCVDQILLCARNSLSDNKDLITKSINPVQCLSLESCPWLNKITHEETLLRRTFNFNRTKIYTKGMFPHDLIIFPPPNEIQQAITFSLDHPRHVREMIKIFPYRDDPLIFGNQLTVINVNYNDTEQTIVFDFSIPGIFSKLQKVSGLRKPVINLRTFIECLIFIPILNNDMRALRIDLTLPGVAAKLKRLAANSIKKVGLPKLQIIARNRVKYDMYIDIFDQNFMNDLLDCSIDRTQLSDYSVLFFPSKLGESWKALLGTNKDQTLWNILDIFSTITIGEQSEDVLVTTGGITSFNFDIYNPSITNHLNSLWKFQPQLDATLETHHIFYLPYKENEFTSISLDLKNPIVIRKFERLSRFSKNIENNLSTFQIIGATDFPYGLNVSLNFDDQKKTKMFLSMMTTNEFDDASIKINNVGVLSNSNAYTVLIWDLPVVRDVVKQLGQNTRLFGKEKKIAHVLEKYQQFPVHLNLDSPISYKLLQSLSKTSMLYFEPIKIKANANVNLFIMAAKNLNTNQPIPFVISESKEFFDKISNLNETFNPKRSVNDQFFEDLWTFDFNDFGEVKVNISDPKVFDILNNLSKNQSVVPVDKWEVVNTKDDDWNKNDELDNEKLNSSKFIIPDFDNERYNYLTILNETLPQSICNGSKDETKILLYENETTHKFDCDLNNPNALSSVIIRIQSMPAHSSIAVMQIPDSSGYLHPFIFDLNVDEVKKLLRNLKQSVRISSTNKVAIYYKDKLRIPEIFVIDLETIQFEYLIEALKYTPCDLIPTDVLNPSKINDNKQNFDLTVFTIPQGNDLNCVDKIPIILNTNDDVTVREIELMEDLNDDSVVIPITYKNGYTMKINVPYLKDENRIDKLKKLTALTGLIKTPVLNTDSILALEYKTKNGKTYSLALNTTNEITKMVLNDLTAEADQTVPLGIVRGNDGDNYEIRLDLDDENVQEQLKSVAITHMYIPESKSLLILKPKLTKTPIILEPKQRLIMKQLLEMAKNDKSKTELDIIQIKDTMGNRRILRINLNDEKNVNILRALEGIEAENTGPIFIPDNHKTIGLVAFKIIANSSVHSLVFNVSSLPINEVLAELNDPTKVRSIPIPIYDEYGNELVTYVDLWNEDNLNTLIRLSAMSNVPEVREPISEDSGIVVIPLEFTTNGVYVVECNVSDLGVTKKLFAIPGVINGRKNPIYIPNPETNELTSLFFNPYDENIVKSLKEICPIGKFINPEFQNLLVDSFEDDDCEPETIILDVQNVNVQKTLDEIRATRIVQNHNQKATAFSYRSKLKTRTVSLDSNVLRKFNKKLRNVELSYEPFVTTIDNKRYLVVGFEYEGRKKVLSFNLEDQSVSKALEELDFLSHGNGITLPTGPYKSLIINVNDDRIREKLIAIYTLYGDDVVQIPSNNMNLEIESDGGIVAKIESTTNQIDVIHINNEDYESYDKVDDQNPIKVGADIPDLPGNVLPDVYDYSKWQDLYNWLQVNDSNEIIQIDENQEFSAGAFEIAPPLKLDDLEIEEEQDLIVNTQQENIDDSKLNQDLILTYIPTPGSLVMFPIKKENVIRIILLDLNDVYTKNVLTSISDQVQLSEATQLFIMDDNILIKLNCEIDEILSSLIEISKAAKVKITPSEFPKVGGGYFLVFTIQNPIDKEIKPIVLDVQNLQVVTKLKSLMAVSPSQPFIVEIGSDEIILDLSDSKTLETLSLISETKIPKEALKNIPIENGIFTKTLTLPVLNEHNEVIQYVYNLEDPQTIDKLLKESEKINQDETVLVLYAQKDYKTIPIKTNLKITPTVDPKIVLNELLPQDVIVFFLSDDKGGTDIIVLDKQNEKVSEMLINYTKKRISSVLQDKTSYCVFNIINQDDFPVEIRLDLTDKTDVALIKELAEETKHPLAPFEMITPFGFEKIVILSGKIKNEDVVLVLNPNEQYVQSVIKEIFHETDRDIFSIIREHKDSILNEEIFEKLLTINKIGIMALEVPIFISQDFIYFSLKINDEIVKIYLDEKELYSIAQNFDTFSTNPTQFLTFLTFDLINLPKIVKIDTNFQDHIDLIKEASLKTIYPTMHKIYPPKSLENLLVYSIPNFESNLNLTLNPNDQNTINIMDYNLKSLNFGIKLKFPIQIGNMVSISIKPEDFVKLNSFSPLQINPLTLIPCKGRGPILNVMVHKDGNWNSFSLDPNSEDVYNALKDQFNANSLENQYQIVFYLNQNRSEMIPVDFFDENTQNVLKKLTEEAPISIIWRRNKNSIIKICSVDCIYLDLDLKSTKDKLISISKNVESTENLPKLFITSQEGLQQEIYLPFYNQNTCSLDLDKIKSFQDQPYKSYNSIPEYYVTLQNSQELTISPIKIIKINQNYPILMLDMKNTVFGGSSLTEITIDFNQPQIIDLVTKKTQNIYNEESSLFEIQDVEGNLHAFWFNLNDRNDLKTFKELSMYSLIQFKSNDLGLPILIIDLIDDKLELNLNLESTIKVLEEVSNNQLTTESCYKIEIPQNDGYSIYFIDFNDQQVVDKFRNNILNQNNFTPALYETTESNYNFTLIDSYNTTWEFNLCLNDFFTADSLIAISQIPTESTSTNLIVLNLNNPIKQHVFINPMSSSTLETLKELHKRCTGENPKIVSAQTEKLTISIDYVGETGSNFKFIFDLNNPGVLEGLKEINETSRGVGTKININLEGNVKSFTINLNDPKVKRKMRVLKEESLWGKNKRRVKRSILEPNKINSKKNQHLWTVLKIATPQIGNISFNYSTENDSVNRKLKNLEKNYSNFSASTRINLINDLNKPYSFEIDLNDPMTLKELLIVNKELKNLNTKSDVINKILHRFQSILIQDPLEKKIITIDTFNQKTIDILTNLFKMYSKGTKLEYFKLGQLIKTTLDTTQHKIKSILNDISTQTLIYSKNNFKPKTKLISIIFLENSTKPIIFDLGNRKTIKTFLDLNNNNKNNNLKLAHFDIVDDFGQFKTISIDLGCPEIQKQLKTKFKQIENVKISINNETKTYILFCGIIKNLNVNEYRTFKIPVSLATLKKSISLEKMYGFTVKLNHESINKTVYFNLDPTQKNLNDLLNLGYLIKNPKSKENFDLFSIYLEKTNQFIDLNLKNEKLKQFLQKQNRQVDFSKPVSVISVLNQYLMVNLNDEIIKKIKNKEFEYENVGIRTMVKENVEKRVRFYVGDKLISLNLGDLNVLKSLKLITQKQLAEENNFKRYVTFEFDDAWGNAINIIINPFDLHTLNQLINLSSK